MPQITVFNHNIPSEITINRNWSCRPSEPENAWKKPYLEEPATVGSLLRALNIGGPIAAIATLGPMNYEVEPIQLDNQIPDHPETPVYGWNASAQRVNKVFQQAIVICGVQKTDTQEQIYYVLADDVSEDPKMAIGKYRASDDKRVFVASLNRYNECEHDMFPPVSEEEITKYQSQKVVPTPLAGRPDLIKAWEKGDLRCEWKDGNWYSSKSKPQHRNTATVAYFK